MNCPQKVLVAHILLWICVCFQTPILASTEYIISYKVLEGSGINQFSEACSQDKTSARLRGSFKVKIMQDDGFLQGEIFDLEMQNLDGDPKFRITGGGIYLESAVSVLELLVRINDFENEYLFCEFCGNAAPFPLIESNLSDISLPDCFFIYLRAGLDESDTNVFFKRGDGNSDGEIDVSDAITILGYLFFGYEIPVCLDSFDVDDTGQIDLSDAVGLVQYLFEGHTSPPAPSKWCGIDPTEDDLPCKSDAPCTDLVRAFENKS
jgi:hypothetical protein